MDRKLFPCMPCFQKTRTLSCRHTAEKQETMRLKETITLWSDMKSWNIWQKRPASGSLGFSCFWFSGATEGNQTEDQNLIGVFPRYEPWGAPSRGFLWQLKVTRYVQTESWQNKLVLPESFSLSDVNSEVCRFRKAEPRGASSWTTVLVFMFFWASGVCKPQKKIAKILAKGKINQNS